MAGKARSDREKRRRRKFKGRKRKSVLDGSQRQNHTKKVSACKGDLFPTFFTSIFLCLSVEKNTG